MSEVAEKVAMLPVFQRDLTASLVLGLAKVPTRTPRLKCEHLGSVIAFDPENHIAVAAGLTKKMAEQLENYYLNQGEAFYPAWAGFKRMSKAELVESYKQWLAKLPKDHALTNHGEVIPR
ncbi:MAG: hypothetical protein AAF756_02275 [Pseudomonadota bacterium]